MPHAQPAPFYPAGRLAMIGIISFLVGHNLPGAVPALNSAF